MIGAAIDCVLLLPGRASANTVLDTGTPTGTGAPALLNTAQWLAGEFAVSSGDTNQAYALSAYLTQGVGQPGDTFTFDIYSSTTFLSRNRGNALFSSTGTFTANGWNLSSTDWTPTTAGDYWLALEVSSSTLTRGLDAPQLSSASVGAVPALAFAYNASAGQFATANAFPIGLEISAVPLPPAVWLLGSGVLGLGAMARRRRR